MNGGEICAGKEKTRTTCYEVMRAFKTIRMVKTSTKFSLEGIPGCQGEPRQNPERPRSHCELRTVLPNLCILCPLSQSCHG